VSVLHSKHVDRGTWSDVLLTSFFAEQTDMYGVVVVCAQPLPEASVDSDTEGAEDDDPPAV